MTTPPETIKRLKKFLQRMNPGVISEANFVRDLRNAAPSLLADAETLAASEARCRGLEEALRNCVPMMEMAWQQYGVGGMFECFDAARSALAAHGTKP